MWLSQSISMLTADFQIYFSADCSFPHVLQCSLQISHGIALLAVARALARGLPRDLTRLRTIASLQRNIAVASVSLHDNAGAAR